VGAFFQEMLRVGIYKRSQGRVTRQITFAALAATIALGLIRLSAIWASSTPLWRFGVPGMLLLVGLWAAYRVVNVPSFADFLIAVEAEMNKVSWPARSELVRAAMVVLIVIFALAFVLAAFDFTWGWLFRKVLHIL
jgi:preprotein translocase subunit SecE